MNPSRASSLIYDITLVFSHHALGPFYCSSSREDLFDIVSREMFASRIILTAGIGENLLPPRKLHGPLDTIEVKSVRLQTYIYPIPIQLDLAQQGIGSITRVLLFCIQFLEERRPLLSQYEEFIQEVFEHITQYIEFDSLFSTTDICQTEATAILRQIRDELDKRLSWKIKGAEMGESLYDLGVVKQLPNELQDVAVALLKFPQGIFLGKLSTLLELSIDQLWDRVRTLELLGFVKIQSKAHSSADKDQMVIVPI